MSNIALMTAIARKEFNKNMQKYNDKIFYSGDTFDRGPMMFCCDNATVTMESDLGEITTTGVRDLRAMAVDNGVTISDRFSEYVRKDELDELIDVIRGQRVFRDSKSAGNAFNKLSKKLSSQKGFRLLNYEKEIKGYELLGQDI